MNTSDEHHIEMFDNSTTCNKTIKREEVEEEEEEEEETQNQEEDEEHFSSSESDICDESLCEEEAQGNEETFIMKKVDPKMILNQEQEISNETNSTISDNPQLLDSNTTNYQSVNRPGEQLFNQHLSSSFANEQVSRREQNHNQLTSQQDKQAINQDPSHHQSSQQATASGTQKDFDEVKQVELFGISIVALTINGKERLCLAQISNTLLKEFSYNEIHNRRVALGITCVQCTPIQLEMLRRAGAMPSSSRRCGMITRREAERLCRSFLVEEHPPELPENFHFNVAHRVNYGCKGRFIPARYISSRAKCIECFYCGDFFSPNKFIFHSHRQPHAGDCNPPDSPNINSWRKHIDLDWNLDHSQEIKYAWEDVKSLFNGGTRRRAPNWSNPNSSSLESGQQQQSTLKSNPLIKENSHANAISPEQHMNKVTFEDCTDQLIDVECDDQVNIIKNHKSSLGQNLINDKHRKQLDDNKLLDRESLKSRLSNNNNNNNRHSSSAKLWMHSGGSTRDARTNNSIIQVNNYNQQQQQQTFRQSSSMKRLNSSGLSLSSTIPSRLGSISNKRHCNTSAGSNVMQNEFNNQKLAPCSIGNINRLSASTQSSSFGPSNLLSPVVSTSQFGEFPLASSQTPAIQRLNNNQDLNINGNLGQSILNRDKQTPNQQSVGLLNQMASYPATTFIYSQLYNQLMQQQQQQQQQQSTQQAAISAAAAAASAISQKPLSSPFPITQTQTQPQQQQQQQLEPQQVAVANGNAIDTQIALRHHLWSSLIANLQCNASDQIYAAAAAAAASSASQQPNLGPPSGSRCSSSLANGDVVLGDVVFGGDSSFQNHNHLGVGSTNMPLKLELSHPQQQ